MYFKKGTAVFFFMLLLCSGCSAPAASKIENAAGKDVENDVEELGKETEDSIEDDTKNNEKQLTDPSDLLDVEEDMASTD